MVTWLIYSVLAIAVFYAVMKTDNHYSSSMDTWETKHLLVAICVSFFGGPLVLGVSIIFAGIFAFYWLSEHGKMDWLNKKL